MGQVSTVVRSKCVSLAALVVAAAATLVCAAAPPAPPPQIPRELGDWTLEYSISGGIEPRTRSVSVTSAGALVGIDTSAGHHITARASNDVVARLTAFLKRAQPAKPSGPPGPDQPSLGLDLTTGGRMYSVEPASDIFKILDDAFDRAVVAALIGDWWESAWKLCKPVEQLDPAAIDPAIDTLIFRSDGTFSVTWLREPRTTGVPQAPVVDFGGEYTLDPSPSQGYIQMSSNGRTVPRDFSGKGMFALADGALTIRNAWFGTRQAKHKPDICELTFKKK